MARPNSPPNPPSGPNEPGNLQDGPLAPEVAAPEVPRTKRKWLDTTYTRHGVHYGPSRFPGDLIEVPADFPDDKGGTEPSPEEWVPLGESAVKETPFIDESGKPL